MPRSRVQHERKRQPVRTAKVYKPWWVSSVQLVGASSLELMVASEFVRRGIYFIHSPATSPIVWPEYLIDTTTDPRTWEADFILPQYKIWLECQGSYFHSMIGAMESDATRFAYVEAAGWRPIAWWEFDIRFHLQDLMNAVPEFQFVDPRLQIGFPHTPGRAFLESGTIDHLAGLRTALAARRKPMQLRVTQVKGRRPK